MKPLIINSSIKQTLNSFLGPLKFLFLKNKTLKDFKCLITLTKTGLPQNCKNTIQSPVPSVLLLWLYLVSHSFALPVLVWIGKIVHQALTRHQASSVTYSSKQKTHERDQRTNRHIFRSIASIIIIKRVFFLELVTKALVNLQFSSPLSDGNYNTGSVCGLLFLLDE